MRISFGPWAVFLIGFGAGVLTTQSFFRDKYQKKADEDIASVVEHFESRYGVKKKKKTVSDNDETEASPVKTKSSMDLGDKSAKNPEYKYHTKVEVNEPETRQHPEEDDDEESTDPYEISFNDYMTDAKYSKVQVTWYEKDGAFAREETDGSNAEPELMEEDERTLFGNVLEQTGFKKDDTIEYLYIRNPSMNTDYEVGKAVGAYFE